MSKWGGFVLGVLTTVVLVVVVSHYNLTDWLFFEVKVHKDIYIFYRDILISVLTSLLVFCSYYFLQSFFISLIDKKHSFNPFVVPINQADSLLHSSGLFLLMGLLWS